MVVDDNPEMAQFLSGLLAKHFHLLHAKDGREALEVARRELPDLVLSDVMMPYMNGFDVCRTVKRELNMSDVYVVMLTAKGQEIDKQRGAEVGADLYVTKPFDPDELLSLAEEVLGLA